MNSHLGYENFTAQSNGNLVEMHSPNCSQRKVTIRGIGYFDFTFCLLRLLHRGKDMLGYGLWLFERYLGNQKPALSRDFAFMNLVSDIIRNWTYLSLLKSP